MMSAAATVELLPVDEHAELAWVAEAEHHVLGHGEIGRVVEVLVHEGEPAADASRG